jgi:general secretion pathway protein A
MATRIPYTFYASPSRSTARPATMRKSAQGLRTTATPVPHSGVLLSTGLECTPRERTIPKLPEIPVNHLAMPLEFPAPRISEEVKMNTAPFPFENLDPVALAEISAFALAPRAPASQETIPPAPTGYGFDEIEERIAQEIATSTEPHTARIPDESAIEPVIVQDGIGTEPITAAEVALDLPVAPAEIISEKAAATDVLTFYGMPQQPFDVTPDPSYLYSSSSHREALTALKEGVEHFRGFMVMVAEPGMGKTTVLHKLMEELTDSARVVFLFQTQCSSRELLCFILNELEVDHTGMDVVSMHRALNQALLEEMLRGRRFVLIVDEAQNLQEPVLETIRLLSDFETTHSKLIQIVLAGQPQLAETLMRPSLVQLRQRISVLSNLKTLSAAETVEYIDYRLRASGWSGDVLFTSEALAQIAESSQGVPRTINNLCFNALLEGFHRGLEIVDAEIVKQVSGKLDLEALIRRPQADPVSQVSATPATPATTIGISELAHPLAAALSAETEPDASVAPLIGPKPRPEVVLTGNLTEKVRSQGWSKRHEYRIMVTLERDPFSGLPVADRYYCCSIYMDEPQAAGLQAGKPVRIKIEQD